MKKELQMELENKYDFMKRDSTMEENTYVKWGCECQSGWHSLIDGCCSEIVKRYHGEGIPIDLVPRQVKEKFGTLRFYYKYEDTEGGTDKIQFRESISDIIREAESRSKHICEQCGMEDEEKVSLRKFKRCGMVRVDTYCESCYQGFDKLLRERQEKRDAMSREEFLKEVGL